MRSTHDGCLPCSRTTELDIETSRTAELRVQLEEWKSGASSYVEKGRKRRASSNALRKSIDIVAKEQMDKPPSLELS